MSVTSDDGGERFVLVDEQGHRIGTATRAECHADPSLVHLSVHIAVVTAEGVLWQFRGPRKDVAPSLWTFACSGHVDAGEEVAATAVRELGEEVGIDVDETTLEPLGNLLVGLGNETELTALFRLRHDGPFRVAPPEVTGLVVLPAPERPAALSPCAEAVCAELDARHPGWDSP
jgi:isopentenyldiphosphate isomerase